MSAPTLKKLSTSGLLALTLTGASAFLTPASAGPILDNADSSARYYLRTAFNALHKPSWTAPSADVSSPAELVQTGYPLRELIPRTTQVDDTRFGIVEDLGPVDTTPAEDLNPADTVVQIDEPGSLALLGLGVLAIVLVRLQQPKV